MTEIDERGAETHEALAKVWFVQSIEEIDRTNHTLSLRLWIRADLFVDVFLGELSGSLYLALIYGQRRVFGIDRESGEWHLHPFASPHRHEPLPGGLEPKPLLRLLAQVETILVAEQLL